MTTCRQGVNTLLLLWPLLLLLLLPQLLLHV
jgi:hypothetical protein